MSQRQPEKREAYINHPDRGTREMALPDGKTCSDCYYFEHCQRLYFQIPSDEVCNFSPNHFADRQEVEAARAKGKLYSGGK